MRSNLTARNLAGMWAGLPVPWTPEDEIDEPALRENVRRMCRAGAHGVYTHGTTGEFYAQSCEEWKRVAAATLEEARAFGTPVQIGCTSLFTRDAVFRMAYAQKEGASAVQIAFPFWLEVSDSQAIRFLTEISHAVPGMPLVIYNTRRSRKTLTPPLLSRILDAGIEVIGCKGVRGADDLRNLHEAAPHVRFFVAESQLAGWWKHGARGCYSSLIYACPRLMLRYYNLCKKGDPAAVQIAGKLQQLTGEFVTPRLKQGMYDTAFDRTFATATGFLSGALLFSRGPYDSATTEDVRQFRDWCAQTFPEFLQDSQAG